MLSTILGGFIAAAVGFSIAWWQRRRDGKDRFLAILGEIESSLDGCGHIDDRTQKVHADSITPLRAAIFAVQPFITAASFERLLTHWRDYQKEHADARTTMEKLAAHDIAGRPPDQRPGYPDDILRSYLQKFRKEVD